MMILFSFLVLLPHVLSSHKFIVTNSDINPFVVQKAISNVGSLSRKVIKKIMNNECLHFQVFGGSVSAGNTCCIITSLEEKPSFHTAYPHSFIGLMNTYLPCNNGSHTINVIAEGGMHTGSWMNQIISKEKHVIQSILEADIIIMDTTVNDIAEGLEQKEMLAKEQKYYTHEIDDKTRLEARIEILIHMFIRYNPQVSILWLGTSSRINWDQNGNPVIVRGDSNDAIQEVLRYYDIPHINVINGIGPFITPKQKHWFETIFRYDSCCHPSVTGHDLIGRILYHYFVNIYQAKEYPLYDGSFALNSMVSIHSYSHSQDSNLNDDNNHVNAKNVSFNNIKLQFASQEYLTTYISTNSLVVSLVHPPIQYEVVSKRKGWSVKTDRPGKPEGYLASDVGDTFGLEIRGKELSLHLLSYKIHINMLRTYENIGMFQVDIGRKTKINDVSSISSSTKIQTIIVDSQWKHLFSQHDTEEINLYKEDWQNLTTKEFMSLNITIIPAVPETRVINKVKLFSIVIF